MSKVVDLGNYRKMVDKVADDAEADTEQMARDMRRDSAKMARMVTMFGLQGSTLAGISEEFGERFANLGLRALVLQSGWLETQES
jgi:hypothetical protein